MVNVTARGIFVPVEKGGRSLEVPLYEVRQLFEEKT